ncbi:NTP transferase domain-containing protein [bacterium]|nr:NTP transferase domain-containing protein [bacterium]
MTAAAPRFEGLVLAAGRSERAGVFKPAHRHRDRPLVVHAVDRLGEWCARVVVVAGHRHDEVSGLVAGRGRVHVAVNHAFDEGMFSSVRTGAAALSTRVEGFFALPVDCPLVAREVFATLIETFDRAGGQRAVVPVHGDRGGHPVLLPGAARAAILAAGPDTILRTIVRAHDAVRVPVASDSVLLDLDTPGDIARLARTDVDDADGHEPTP